MILFLPLSYPSECGSPENSQLLSEFYSPIVVDVEPVNERFIRRQPVQARLGLLCCNHAVC